MKTFQIQTHEQHKHATKQRNDGEIEVNFQLLNAINSYTSRDANMFSFHRSPIQKYTGSVRTH